MKFRAASRVPRYIDRFPVDLGQHRAKRRRLVHRAMSEALEGRTLLSSVIVNANADASASIGGTIISGLNGSGIAGRTVYIDANRDGQLDDGEISTTTDSSGNFAFNNLPAGAYRISQVLPTGATSADPSNDFRDVTVVSGQILSGVSFADLPAPAADGPAFAATFLKPLPSSVVGGAKGTASVRIVNGGTTTASGPQTLTLLSSTSANFSISNVVVSTVSLGTLEIKPGASRTLTIKFNYPSKLPSGSYSLLAVPDSSNSVAQTSFNIAASSSVVIAPPFTQLQGNLPGRPPRTVTAGKKSGISVRVGNVGNELFSGPLSISLYESPDMGLAGGDLFLITFNIPRSAIKAGGQATYHIAFKAPSNVMAGSEYIVAVVNGGAPAASSSTVTFG